MLNGAGRCPTFFFFFPSPPSHIAANCSIGHLPTFRQQLHKNCFFSWNLGPLLMCDLQRRLPINVVELFTVTSARGCQQPSLRRCRSVRAAASRDKAVPVWWGPCVARRGWPRARGEGRQLRHAAVHLQSRRSSVPEPSCPERRGCPWPAPGCREPARA